MTDNTDTGDSLVNTSDVVGPHVSETRNER